MKRAINRVGLVVCVVAWSGATAMADWPAGDGMIVSDGCNEQSIPRVRPTSDGGCYVSWFDNCSGGYDIFLQRLDASGNEQWAHNGIQIANRAYSWTQYYGLDVDADDNALLAFRDDRFGGLGAIVTVVKVAPDGTMPWGAIGVQVSAANDIATSPRVAATSDGNVVVSWGCEDSAGVASIRFQKLNAAGERQWGDGIVVLTPDGGFFLNADLHAGESGTVIASWVHQGPMFWSPRYLWAQKYSPSGQPLWGDDPLVVYDGGSMQFGYQPPFVPDGSGGALFRWYHTSPTLQCFVQHVLADGTEQFGHNGVAASTMTWENRVDPCVSFDPVTNETYLFWVEMRIDQADRGLWGQKFDHNGVRLWTDHGREFVTPGLYDVHSLASIQHGEGAFISWIKSPSPVAQDQVLAARVDGNGDFVWNTPMLDVTTTASDKSRLSVVPGQTDAFLMVWMDDRAGTNDIYAQSVCPDGTMGTCGGKPGDLNCDGAVDFDDIDPFVLALSGEEAYLATYPDCRWLNADCNDDDAVDFDDIDAFVAVLGTSRP